MLSVKIPKLAAAFCATLLFAGASLAGPIDDLLPGEWYEIPNSRLRSAAMSPNPSGVNGTAGVTGVMRAFSGGAYDSVRDRLLVHGGGHSDYGGNELYAFDLASETWLRLTDPSSMNGFSENSSTMPDGRPKAVHTYDQLQFDPISGKFFRTAGATFSQGSVTSTTWLFNFDTNDWERQQNIPGPIYDLLQLSLTSDYDPVSRRIILLGNTSAGDFNPASGEWRKQGSDTFPWRELGQTGAVDPIRRKFVAIGRGKSFVFDIDNTGLLSNRRSLNAGGANEIINFDAPGLVFDPTIERLVAWGSGANVYSLDMDTNTWEAHAATNNVSPGNPYSNTYNGTFGRFRYVPSRNLFIVATSVDSNVFVYKLSDVTVTRVPPNPPDALIVVD